jgi:hypothetical protein
MLFFRDAVIHETRRILETLHKPIPFTAKPWNVHTVTGKPVHARNAAGPVAGLFRLRNICWSSQA